mmetsp:Transcript_19794/g.50277  ORF Transcript_19794/g.50277 Transcript_19794/m.50277 type:complete len:389 (-) Transcript_19794:120-1286(-)
MFDSQPESRVDAPCSATAVDLFRPVDGCGIRSSDVVRFIHDTYQHGRRPPNVRISSRTRRASVPGLGRFGIEAFSCPPSAESAARVQVEGRRAQEALERCSPHAVAQDILEALDSFIHPPSGVRIAAIQDHVDQAGELVKCSSVVQQSSASSPVSRSQHLAVPPCGDFTFGRKRGLEEPRGEASLCSWYSVLAEQGSSSVVFAPSRHATGLTSEFWADCVRALVSRADPARLGSITNVLQKAKGNECGLYFALCKKYGVEPQVQFQGSQVRRQLTDLAFLTQTDAGEFWTDRIRQLYGSVGSNVDVEALLNKFVGHECALYIAATGKFGLQIDPFADIASDSQSSFAPIGEGSSAETLQKQSTPALAIARGPQPHNAPSQAAAKRRRT